MNIWKTKLGNWEESYGILCQALYVPGKSNTRTPFGNTLCVIEPGGEAHRHAHLDQESFLILSGAGQIQMAEETMPLEEGDVVHIPAQTEHRIYNPHSDSLKFLSIYWITPQAEKPSTAATLVIPAPPTPNGPLHLGHLSGPYLAADVYTRAQNALGKKAVYCLGTDDNQCYVPAKARQLGISNTEVIERFAPQIESVLQKFSSQITHFLRPYGNAEYTQFVQTLFADWVKRGVLELREAPTLFCEDTQTYLYGASVRGICPHCRAETGGNGCEGCGHYNDCVDLIDYRSNLADGKVSVRTVSRYYFPLSKYAEKVAGYLSQIEMHPWLRNFYETYVSKGLPDVSASHPGEWGISAGIEGQVIYEWIEMAAGYIYLSTKNAREGQDFWRHDRTVEAFGIDNSFFYGLLMPALMGEVEGVRPPHAFLFNHFYQLDGKKFSTSRNHAVWGHEILQFVAADPLRFFLSLTRSEDRPTNFSLNDFESFIARELVGQWESFFSNLDTELGTDGKWFAVESMAGFQESYVLEATRLLWTAESALAAENFSLRRAAKALNDVISLSDAFLRRHGADRRHRGANTSLCLSVIEQWIALLTVFMPKFASQLGESLGAPVPYRGEVTLNRSERTIKPFAVHTFSDALEKLKQFRSSR